MAEDDRPAVLFLCTGNSCRSQMAEGWLRHLAGDRYEALSAGIEPRPIHPMAVKAMAEVGIDICVQRSKSAAEFFGRKAIRIAVFVCAKAERECPIVYPFTMQTLSWPLEDPAAFAGTEEENSARFADVRDRLGALITAWLESQGPNDKESNDV